MLSMRSLYQVNVYAVIYNRKCELFTVYGASNQHRQSHKLDVTYVMLFPLVVTGFPYISLGETFGVATQSVPAVDDGVSSPISVQFPFGSEIESTVYVCGDNIMLYLLGIYISN